MFFEKNAQALASDRRNQTVYDAVLATEAASDVELFQTEAGDYTLVRHGVALHHAAGAMLEAQAVCTPALFHPGLRSNHIILGIGLGYLLDFVYRQSSGKIFVYEPDLPLLRFVLENVDLSEHLASQRVYLASDPADLFAKIQKRYILGEEIDVLMTQGYAQLLSPEIPGLMERLFTVAQEQQANIGVGMAYHLDWVRQFLGNVPAFSETIPFDVLVDKFKNRPALVVSSGPSLDQAMPEIQKYRDSYVLVAVGGALRPLMAAGITPDFATFLDFMGPKQQLHALPLSTETVRFLLGPFAEGESFAVPSAGRYLVSCQNYSAMADWLDRTLDVQRYRVPVGSTVSVMALECAKAMGCNPLILVGQDLALSGGQYYAGGITANLDEDGYVSLPDSEVMVGRKVKLLDIPGQNGDVLKTTPDYFSFRQHLQEFAEQNKATLQLLNASVGGALIEGFEHLSLAQIQARLQCLVGQDSIAQMLVTQPLTHTKPQFAGALKELQQSAEQAVHVAGLLLQPLSSMVSALSGFKPEQLQEGWAQLETEYGPLYRQHRTAFSACLNTQPFLEYCLKKEIWELQESFTFEPVSVQDYFSNLVVDQRYFTAAKNLLSDRILPWLMQAQEKMR